MKKSLFAVLMVVAMVSSVASWAKGGASVRIYDDKGFSGRVLRVRVGKNIPDLKYAGDGFNDKCSSVQYSIPAGWTAILYTDSGYKGREYPLNGSGSVGDLQSFEDKCSSIQWMKK